MASGNINKEVRILYKTITTDGDGGAQLGLDYNYCSVIGIDCGRDGTIPYVIIAGNRERWSCVVKSVWNGNPIANTELSLIIYYILK